MWPLPLLVLLGLPATTAGNEIGDVTAGWHRVGRGCCSFQGAVVTDLVLGPADGIAVKEDCQRACLVDTAWCSAITYARLTHRCALHAASADGSTGTETSG